MTGPAIASILKGRRVLIVEDEMLVAFDMQSMLTDHGCVVVGPASSVAQAEAAVERDRPDAALLDLNLKGERATPVAKALLRHNVPFVVLSGYGEGQFSAPELKDAPRLNKPVDSAHLVRVLAAMLEAAAAPTAVRGGG